MNSGYLRYNTIQLYENGVPTTTYSIPVNATANDIATITGMSISRATQLYNSRVVLNLQQCPIPSISIIQFEQDTYNVTEPDTGVTMCNVKLKRTNGCEGTVTVVVDRIGGTASVATDFNNIFPIAVTWLDGDCTDKTINIPIVGDMVTESPETIELQITGVSGNGGIGVLDTTTVNIIDTDLTWLVTVFVDSSSTCIPNGYPLSYSVPNNTNLNIPISNTCDLETILINNINQPTIDVTLAKQNGSYTLSNVTENKTIALKYKQFVIPCSLAITSTSLPNGIKNSSYLTFINTMGAVGNITWSIVSGSLPTGVFLNGYDLTRATLSGIPTVNGTFNFVIRAKDANGCISELPFVLNINCSNIKVVPYNSNNGVPSGIPYNITAYLNESFSFQLIQENGTNPSTYQITSGNLPVGYSMNSSGLITGFSSVTNSSSFTVTVTDSTGCTGTGDYFLSVNYRVVPCVQDGGVFNNTSSTTTTTYNMSPFGGRMAFLVSGTGSGAYCSIVDDNGVKASTSMFLSNAGTYNTTGDLISTSLGTVPTRKTEYETTNGVLLNMQGYQQIVWYNYTAEDYNNSPSKTIGFTYFGVGAYLKICD